MVLTTLTLKLKKTDHKKIPTFLFDIAKLKDPDVANTFEARRGGRFAEVKVSKKTSTSSLTTSMEQPHKHNHISTWHRKKQNPTVDYQRYPGSLRHKEKHEADK